MFVALDEHGTALPGVEVVVSNTVTRQAKTDAEGVAVIPALPVGTYRLAARLPGFVPESREVIISAGLTTALTVELRINWPIDPISGKRIQQVLGVDYCNFLAPAFAEEFWQAADAVARIRIDSQLVYDHWKPRGDRVPIVTQHEAQVRELFKPHPKLPASAGAVTIIQEGGTIERPDVIDWFSVSHSTLLERGREYLVFLRWADWWDGWTVAHCDLGTFEIDGELVSPLASAEMGRAWKGRLAEELLEILRKMMSVKR